MAITTTPLGFKKPDGGELVRGGDDIIAANAQNAEDVIAAVRSRVANVEASVSGNTILTPDPANPGLYLIA